MRIVGKKEFITRDISIKDAYLGILADDNQVIKGAVINYLHEGKLVCIHLQNNLNETKVDSTFETEFQITRYKKYHTNDLIAAVLVTTNLKNSVINNNKLTQYDLN